MRWGIVPSWWKKPLKPAPENASKNGSFRRASTERGLATMIRR
jgi:hypothetical protein